MFEVFGRTGPQSLGGLQFWTLNISYQTVNDGVAHSKNPKKCAYHVTFDLAHPAMVITVRFSFTTGVRIA